MRGKDVDFGILILRLGVGGILLFYGCQKMLGLFAGHGFSGTVHGMEKMGFAPILGTLSIFAEFFGSLGLITGTLTRVAAFGVAINMAVATWVMTKQPDLFRNVFVFGEQGNYKDFAYPLLLCLGALALVFTGGGRFALDARLFGK